MRCKPIGKPLRGTWSPFRAAITRAGATEEVRQLIDELSRTSPEFDTLWRENDIVSHGGGLKQFRHPVVGMLSMEYSSFAVDGRPDLTLVIYQPAAAEDIKRVRELLKLGGDDNTILHLQFASLCHLRHRQLGLYQFPLAFTSPPTTSPLP